MDGKKSKFEYNGFVGGWDHFAVNADKYTKEQAEAIYREEECYDDEPTPYKVGKAWVKWRAGVNEDNEPCVGWWIEYKEPQKGAVPVWVFSYERGGK